MVALHGMGKRRITNPATIIPERGGGVALALPPTRTAQPPLPDGDSRES